MLIITRQSAVRVNRRLTNGPVSSYVKIASHETIYGHKKKVCLEQNVSIGSIVGNKVISCFISPLFMVFLYIREMTTKANNGLNKF